MREKLQTLPLTQLKELAKAQGIKGVTGMRKADLIDKLCRLAEQEEIIKTAVAPPQLRQTGQTETRTESRGDRYGKTERSDRTEKAERSDRYEKTDRSERMDRSEKTERYERGERNERFDRYEKNDRTEKSEQTNRGERQEYYSERGERVIRQMPRQQEPLSAQEVADLDSGIEANGILEGMPDGFGFIRCENFLPGDNDVYVAPSQIRRFNLKTGDIIVGNRRVKTAAEKFAALLYIRNVNGYPISVVERRPNFEDLSLAPEVQPYFR